MFFKNKPQDKEREINLLMLIGIAKKIGMTPKELTEASVDLKEGTAFMTEMAKCAMDIALKRSNEDNK